MEIRNFDTFQTTFLMRYFKHKCYQCAIIKLFPFCASVSFKFRICVNSGQKGDFLKRTSIVDTAFPFFFPSVLLSSKHHLKAKFGMYFDKPSSCIFEWCGGNPFYRDKTNFRWRKNCFLSEGIHKQCLEKFGKAICFLTGNWTILMPLANI